MTSWEEKQEGVDGLFEVIEERVREREPILGKLPDFKNMVEDGLEQVLRMVQSRMRGAAAATATANDDEGGVESSAGEVAKATNTDDITDVMGVKKETSVPIFMDLLAVKSGDSSGDKASPSLSNFFTKSNDGGVLNLVYPLKVHHDEGVGRMVEEWELAANKETKRIMMRDAMKEIASKVVESANCCGGDVSDDMKGAAKVFVVGKRGVGKTAALAGLVASARVSGHIVAYLPDGDRLRKHGFYVEPCSQRKGLYNLPEIAKEFCEQLLTSHGGDLDKMIASKEVMKGYLTSDQITRVFTRAHNTDDDAGDTTNTDAATTELSLSKLLEVGSGSSSLSSGCYSTVISALMNQRDKPFTVVMDEFNCYYDHGHYFHMDYDEHVRKAIPLNKITVFKPFIDAMGLYPSEAGNDITSDGATEQSQALMKWGSLIVATSESRAVRRSFTQALTESARAQSQDEKHPTHVVDIRRFSDIEVQHILYNFEITGIGRLRFDRGDTALNPEEVEYLRMVSGGLGQPLLDACMIPY
eukprot:scaffold462_cov181-Alexandrium_tamarense.AAC.7